MVVRLYSYDTGNESIDRLFSYVHAELVILHGIEDLDKVLSITKDNIDNNIDRVQYLSDDGTTKEYVIINKGWI